MALKDIWIDRVDGVDEASAEDINQVAHAVIENEDVISETTKNVVQNTEKINNIRHDYPLFSNAIKGSASGEMVSLNDVSPITHDIAASVRKKNLCPVASITTDEDVAGFIKIQDLTKHGTYTFSADITLYEDDVSKNPRASIQVWYEDNTVTSAVYVDGIPKNGVAKRISITCSTDSTKTIKHIRIFALDYTQDGGSRHAKAENIQLEEGATATPYAPYIADTSSVKVKALGKNLATAQQVYEGANKYAVMEYEGRTCVRFVDNITTKKTFIPFKPNTQYTVSFDARVVFREDVVETTGGLFSFWYDDGTHRTISSKRNEEWEHFTFTSLAGKTVVAIGIATYNFVNYNYIDINSFQLEESPIETEYEPYKEPVTYAQGEPITSIYPCTTLMTDTAGAFMDVTYNRDANKVVNELAARLAALEAAALN
jgi:hypothetical protein